MEQTKSATKEQASEEYANKVCGPHKNDSMPEVVYLWQGCKEDFEAGYNHAASQFQSQLDKLQKFKDYVHDRLDKIGVPVDPESKHKAAGCRIGGRLDFIQSQLSEKDEEIKELVEAVKLALPYVDEAYECASHDANAYVKERLQSVLQHQESKS